MSMAIWTGVTISSGADEVVLDGTSNSVCVKDIKNSPILAIMLSFKGSMIPIKSLPKYLLIYLIILKTIYGIQRNKIIM